MLTAIKTEPEPTVRQSQDPRIVGYPSRLNLYHFPPPYEIKIEQFELFALDRLTVLKAIETASIRNSLKSKESGYNPNVLTILKEKLGLSRNSLLKTGDISKRKTMRKQQFEERKKDHVSHFILQLAFCQSVDLRAWFSKLETELFRIRLSEEDSESIHQLIEQADFGGQVMNVATYKPPPGKEAKDFHAALLLDLQRLYNLSEQEISKQSFFKVPFETVMDQVRNRQVIVKRGFAYVPRTLQTVLLVNMFKERLEESLEALAKALPGVEEDEHVTPILQSLAKQHLSATSQTFGTDDSAKFTHADVDALSTRHFAPCMRNLHGNLRSNAHLKHFGRLQYGLFIKGMRAYQIIAGIGLPYEESLTYWRKAFHRMTDEQFQKGGHTYNIRHSYGLEGKRQNYSPYSCLKIITSNHPGAGDHHGCPFKHFGGDNLRTYLSEYIAGARGEASSGNAVQAGVQEVLNITKAGHYQVACTRLFELTHGEKGKEGETGDIVIEHPNQYFELSLKFGKEGGGEGEKADVKMEGGDSGRGEEVKDVVMGDVDKEVVDVKMESLINCV